MLKRIFFTIAFVILFFPILLSQNLKSIEGIVVDEKTSIPLSGVSILVNQIPKTISDEEGVWKLELPNSDSTYYIQFKYISYEITEKTIIPSKTNSKLFIFLKEKQNILDEVVVSSSKHGRKVSEEIKSVDVLKTQLITNSNPVSISDVFTKVAGVYIIDGQVNMRGGTGFTKGAGSRVQLIVDDLPLISADKGDTKWNMVPLENTEQIEVLKGAESVLYGSSALNGVIQVMTAWPKLGPTQNDFSLQLGSIGNPEKNQTKWWDNPPTSINFSGLHKKKLATNDFVLGYAVGKNRSHLNGEYNDFGRINFKTRHHNQKIKNLNYGINGNMMYLDEGIFFLWQDADTNIMQPQGGEFGTDGSSILQYKNFWTSLDPHATYYSKNGAKTSYRGRIYYTSIYDKDFKNTNQSFVVSNEIQHSAKFQELLNYTIGVNSTIFNVKDNILKMHDGHRESMFLQTTFKKGWFTWTQGIRLEYLSIDTIQTFLPPIFELGCNLQLSKSTFVRASAGQGYRLPSITEQNVVDKLGPISIFPNPNLVPEEGWNAELAIKKGFQSNGLNGFVDLAWFLTENKNITEFVFNYHNINFNGQNLTGFGFQSQNIPLSRITGLDFSARADGSIGNFPINLIGGYTYSFPIDLSSSNQYKKYGDFFKQAIYAFNHTDTSVFNHLMRYRYRHIARIDVESSWNRITFGGAVNYYSKMDKVDGAFQVFLPSIKQYMENHNSDFIFLARLGYRFSDKSTVNIVINNVANREYALRPGKLDAPRNISIQYRLKII